jgi:hypothetical protein
MTEQRKRGLGDRLRDKVREWAEVLGELLEPGGGPEPVPIPVTPRGRRPRRTSE